MRTPVTLALFLCLAFAGCATAPIATSTAVHGQAIQGAVHGGQQPVVGTHVYLFAANTTGYGGSGIAPSASNASISLLQNIPGSTTLDTSGGPTNNNYYVTTDTSGSFSITGDYTCTSGQQVYLYALGGNPTYPNGSANASIGELAIAGNCPSADTFAPTVPFVIINEVSTIAAAYAFAGFASDATHVSSSGTPLALTGIANAFANAANLVSLAAGAALATTPAGNGTVPQATINTLGNTLASCINSTGGVTGPSNPTTCYTLFNSAPSLTAASVIPSETATAAINIAQNPGSNVAGLYAISTPSAPFSPALTTQPNDFTIALNFTGGGINSPVFIAIDSLGNAWIPNYAYNSSISKFSSTGAALSPSAGYTGGGLNYPISLAVDASGDIWVTDILGVYAPNNLSKFTNAGVPLSPSTGYTGGGLNYPWSIAFEPSGDLWIANDETAANSISEFTAAGTALSPSSGYTGGGVRDPISLAIDPSGNVWIANGFDSVSEFSSSATALSPSSGFIGGGLANPYSIAIDGYSNVWIANNHPASISKFSNVGVALSPSTGYTGGGLAYTESIAVDGAGNVWTANSDPGSISEFSSSGIALSPSTGFTGGGMYSPISIAIDGSGDAWIVNSGGNSVAEFIGVATPVVTPILANLISPYDAPASKP